MRRLVLISGLAISPSFSDGKGEKKGGEEVPGHVDQVEALKALNGGRVFYEVVPHAEFFITKDRKVQNTFVDDEGEATDPMNSLKKLCARLDLRKFDSIFLRKQVTGGTLMLRVSKSKAAPRIKSALLI